MPRTQYVKNCFPTKPVNVDQVELLTRGSKRFPEINTYFRGFNTPIGIEVEVEKVSFPSEKLMYWRAEEDGSLKIQGLELVSVPIAGHNIDYALAELESYLKNFECLWSHRTSIHVHIYVGDFSMEKLRAFTALYAVFESLLFSQVEDHRRGNSYCYHLRDLEPASIDVGNPDLKYCAFNLGTGIGNYNTVEFRHMHGTGDMVKIRRWIQLVVKLHRFVKETNNKYIFQLINDLNTTSQYAEITNRVFGKTAVLFMDRNLKNELSEGATWAKVYLLGAV